MVKISVSKKVVKLTSSSNYSSAMTKKGRLQSIKHYLYYLEYII